MAKPDSEMLYHLLPAVYRNRDAELGEPLRALLAVLEAERQVLEEDIDHLYENWFIETCDEWVVPYIGNLLGIPGLHAGSADTFSLRAFVANTVAYRRRKGTASGLEQLARDVTGWNARVVEYFRRLSTTQCVNHIRPDNKANVSLFDPEPLDLLGTPFDELPRTAQVGSIAGRRGKHNINNVGVFPWRLGSYVMEKGTPRPVSDQPHGPYTFNPLGCDMPLFNRPQTEAKITHLAEEINVPGRLRRLPLFRELENRRKALENGKRPTEVYFGTQPVMEIYLDDHDEPIPPEEIVISNLSDWDTSGWEPPACEEHTHYGGEDYKTRVAVDPELGRLATLAGIDPPDRVRVSYAYGFSGDIGGGPYDRLDTLLRTTNSESLGTVSLDLLENGDTGESFCWDNEVIEIIDSGIYTLGPDALTVSLTSDQDLVIQARNGCRPLLRFVNSDSQIPSLMVTDSSPMNVDASRANASLTLNGLLIEGGIHIESSCLKQLNIVHCTLIPGRKLDHEGKPVYPDGASLIVNAGNPNLEVHIDHSIMGPLALPAKMKSLSVRDSIIDAPDSSIPAIGPAGQGTGDQEQFGPRTTLERATVFGAVCIRELELASEVIFDGLVMVERRQMGCVRFSYVPPDSQVPRKFHSQPDLAVEQLAAGGSQEAVPSWRIRHILGTIRPTFTSRRYGHPGYCQLSLTCPIQIRTGAENGSEMGVFHYLMQPQREANLRTSLDEYLRFGLEAGIFYVT